MLPLLADDDDAAAAAGVEVEVASRMLLLLPLAWSIACFGVAGAAGGVGASRGVTGLLLG
jgi:hypothetical protein